MFDPARYGISITKVLVDGEDLFCALVRELPDVECFEEGPNEAYEAAIEVISGLHALAVEMAKPFPSPSLEQTVYSGRVTLRLPRSLHRAADLAATAENVSLNSYLSSVIAVAVGHASVQAPKSSQIGIAAQSAAFGPVVDLLSFYPGTSIGHASALAIDSHRTAGSTIYLTDIEPSSMQENVLAFPIWSEAVRRAR